MKILVVGGGGREHALCWALEKSPKCEELYCAPGNAGIAECATCVDISADNIEALVSFAKDKAIDLVMIGPEAPLVKGLADRLSDEDIDAFGPSAAAAQLEGSKGFMKDLCAKYNIPTAAYGRFSDFDKAKAFIQKMGAPIVVKTDGLAAGKGVIIAQNEEEAIEAVRDMLSGDAFGDAGHEIVIEEFMDGEELSYFALADGKTLLPLTSAQDHKRVGEADTGLNTGGMGAYSPAHMMTPALEEKILKNIIEPTLNGMAQDGCPFTGVLFAGLMVVDGEPKLIEYNVRFGDPECQPLMMRLQSDIAEILQAGAQGRLSEFLGTLSWSKRPALCVVMAAEGYPGSYTKNTVIKGLDEAGALEDVIVFHAGTALSDAGEMLSIGGRVLGVTAVADTIAGAQNRAYTAVDKINWLEGFCRRDIGWRAVEAEKDQTIK